MLLIEIAHLSPTKTKHYLSKIVKGRGKQGWYHFSSVETEDEVKPEQKKVQADEEQEQEVMLEDLAEEELEGPEEEVEIPEEEEEGEEEGEEEEEEATTEGNEVEEPVEVKDFYVISYHKDVHHNN